MVDGLMVEYMAQSHQRLLNDVILPAAERREAAMRVLEAGKAPCAGRAVRRNRVKGLVHGLVAALGHLPFIPSPRAHQA